MNIIMKKQCTEMAIKLLILTLLKMLMETFLGYKKILLTSKKTQQLVKLVKYKLI